MGKLKYNEEDWDFGFNAIDETELEAVQEAEHAIQESQQIGTELETAQEKLDYVYQMTTSLLRKLAEDADKDYIYWPNREKSIEAAMNKLNEVVL